MSLSPRAIATLGVGFGAVSVAYLGLWPLSITPPQPPDFGPVLVSGSHIHIPTYRDEFRDDKDLLETIPVLVEILNGRR